MGQVTVPPPGGGMDKGGGLDMGGSGYNVVMELHQHNIYTLCVNKICSNILSMMKIITCSLVSLLLATVAKTWQCSLFLAYLFITNARKSLQNRQHWVAVASRMLL